MSAVARPRWPRVVVATVLAVASLTLAGCSGWDEAQQQPAHPLTKTSFPATVQAAEKNMHSVHEHIVTQAGKQSSTVDADVVIDPQAPSVRETITTTGQPKTQVIYVGSVFYVNAGAATHDAWVTIDPKDPSNPLGAAATSLLSSISQTDPNQAAAAQKAAIAYVQPAGNPVVLDGERTTPYLVAVTTAAALSQLGVLGQAVAKSLPAQLGYVWWIGDDGLPRRYSIVMAGVNQDARFTAWNKPIHIAPPAAGGVSGAPAQT